MELEGYSLVTVSKQWSQDLNLTHKSRDVTVTFRHLIFLEQPFYIWYEFVFQKSKKKKKRWGMPMISDAHKFWGTSEITLRVMRNKIPFQEIQMYSLVL